MIDGLRKQAELREQALSGADRLGWKSGFGTEGAMSLIGVEQPLTGFLTSATLADDGAEIQVGDWGMPLLEPEVAVKLGSELGPGASTEEASAAISAVAAAIELVDLGSIESVEEILAGNIFHRHVLLGEFIDCRPGELEGVRIAVTANGDSSPPADPVEVIGDIGKVVAALADQVDLFGETFQPGDIVITGAAVPPAPVQSGEDYRVELNNGSGVSVGIS